MTEKKQYMTDKRRTYTQPEVVPVRAPAGACGASADSREEAQMSIYHLSAKIFSRSDGVSIIARAAYRSGTRMTDPETGKTYDYRRKIEAVYSEISLCPNAPEQYRDRNTLWCSVQEEEHASNSQIAREIEAALPIEYSRDQQIRVMKDYIEQNFTSQGMICDWTIHDKPGNPHCHMLLTMRPIKKDGSWGSKKTSRTKTDPVTGERIPVIDPKTGKQKMGKQNRLIWERETIPSTDWNTHEALQRWRTSWAEINNRELSRMHSELISEKSNKARGIHTEATVHEGYQARKIEREGGISDRCELNREIRKKNSSITALYERLKKVTEELSALLQERRRRLKQLMPFLEHDEGQELTR